MKGWQYWDTFSEQWESCGCPNSGWRADAIAMGIRHRRTPRRKAKEAGKR